MSRMSRRQFLQTAVMGTAAAGALGVSGGALAAFADEASEEAATEDATTEETEESTTETEDSTTSDWRTPPDPIDESLIVEESTYDFVVLGAGHAGTNCARKIARTAYEEGSGLTVALLEWKTEENYYTLGNDIGHVNSSLDGMEDTFLTEHGVPRIDPIDFFNEWMMKGSNTSNPSIMMQFAQNGGLAMNEFMEEIPEELIPMFVVSHWGDTDEDGNWIWWKRDENGDPVYDDEGNYVPQDIYDNFPNYIADTVEGIGHQHFWIGATMLRSGYQNPEVNGGEEFLMTDAYKIQHEAIRNYGGDVIYDREGQQLLQDDEGRVVGLIASDSEGNYYKYNALRAVVLATGGFSGNDEMAHELLPNYVDLCDEGEDIGNPFNADESGLGIQMGVWAGGRLEPRPMACNGGDYITYSGTGQGNGGASIWLDEYGERFCNEFFGGPNWAGKPGMRGRHVNKYNMFGSNVADLMDMGVPAHSATYWNVTSNRESLQASMDAAYEGYLNGEGGSGSLYCGMTFEELATNMGLDDTTPTPNGETLWQNYVDSCYHYQEMCDLGRDDDFGREAKVLIKYEAPYFGGSGASGMVGQYMATHGGFMTNKHMQVLDDNKDTIPGLYCGGNCLGRRFGGGWYYTPITGVSVGTAVVLGWCLGKYLAEECPLVADVTDWKFTTGTAMDQTAVGTVDELRGETEEDTEEEVAEGEAELAAEEA